MFSTTLKVLFPIVVPVIVVLLLLLLPALPTTLARTDSSSVPPSLKATSADESISIDTSSPATPVIAKQTIVLPLWKEEASSPLPPPTQKHTPLPTFAWGHVTKYSTRLFDKCLVFQKPTMFYVRYPEIENSNSHTIIGINVYPNDDDIPTVGTDLDTSASRATGNSNLQVYPVKGGIGYNSTVIRFSFNSDGEVTSRFTYTLVIHGVDV